MTTEAETQLALVNSAIQATLTGNWESVGDERGNLRRLSLKELREMRKELTREINRESNSTRGRVNLGQFR